METILKYSYLVKIGSKPTKLSIIVNFLFSLRRKVVYGWDLWTKIRQTGNSGTPKQKVNK